jgi:hypothetical protein
MIEAGVARTERLFAPTDPCDAERSFVFAAISRPPGRITSVSRCDPNSEMLRLASSNRAKPCAGAQIALSISRPGACPNLIVFGFIQTVVSASAATSPIPVVAPSGRLP